MGGEGLREGFQNLCVFVFNGSLSDSFAVVLNLVLRGEIIPMRIEGEYFPPYCARCVWAKMLTRF